MSNDRTEKRLVMGCLLAAVVTAVGGAIAFQILQARLAGPPVTFILPEKFHGSFFLVKDANGMEVKPEAEGFHLFIPPDAVLRIKSFQPMERIHRVFARDVKGRAIRVGGGDNYFGTALNAVPTEGTHEYTVWFVGSYSEFNRLRDHPPKPPEH